MLRKFSISFESIDFADKICSKSKCELYHYQKNFSPIIESFQLGNKVLINLTEKSESIRFIFKANNELLGSVSISIDLYINQMENSLTQWFTIFDDPEDDMFDGEMGQDDLESPRVLLSFELFESKEEEEKNEDNYEKYQESEENFSPGFSFDKIENSLDFRNLKNVNFEDQPEELVSHFNSMLNKVQMPEDLVQVTNQINLLRTDLEHPNANDYKKRSSTFNLQKVEEMIALEKFNREYEDEIKLLKLELKKKQGIENKIDEFKEKIRIWEDKYNSVLKNYQDCIKNFDKKIKEINKENLELKQKVINLSNSNNENKKNNNFVLEEQKYDFSIENKQKFKNLELIISDLESKIISMSQEIDQINQTKLILSQKNKEILEKYQLQTISINDSEDKLSKYESEKIQEIEHLNLINKELTRENQFLKSENLLNIQKIKQQDSEIQEINKIREKTIIEFEKKIEDNIFKLSNIEKEKNKFKFELEKINSLNYDEKINDLEKENNELKELLNEKEENKDLIHQQLINSHNLFEKRLEELEKDKNKFIKKFENEKKVYDDKISDLSRELEEKNKKIIEMEYTITENKMKLASTTESNQLIKKYKKQLKECQKALAIHETEREKQHLGLYKVTQELIRQTNITIDQSHTINLLSNEIQRLEGNLMAAQEQLESKTKKDKFPLKTPDIGIISSQISQIDGATTELDEKLEEYYNTNETMVKFIKISDGQYYFGTRQVQLRIWKGKIAVRMGGGFMVLNEFLRLFTMQELKKLKQIEKNNTSSVPLKTQTAENMIFKGEFIPKESKFKKRNTSDNINIDKN